MADAGASTEAMEANAGGSDMLDFSENGSSIGSRTPRVRETLDEHGVPVAGEDLGCDQAGPSNSKRTRHVIVETANTDSSRCHVCEQIGLTSGVRAGDSRSSRRRTATL